MSAPKSSGSEKFSRFGEKRKIGSDTAGYDEYVEGVEADETSSLETPLKEDNLGFKLIQKMGWNSGTGLGKFEQGRVNPVPFEKKDDHMGLGRWTMEMELAQDATDKRRQLEVEKELSEDLMEQYRQQAEKEKKMLEILTEMNKAFYCELCDRQYTKYSEYDNHINSYSHHHQQRLRDLKQYETGRKFGGNRNEQEEQEKMVAAHMVAIERAQMRARQERKKNRGHAPAFKPFGEQSGTTVSTTITTNSGSGKMGGDKRTAEDTEPQGKIANKKNKYSMKFQSAGTLVSIGEDRIGKDTPLLKAANPNPSQHETVKASGETKVGSKGKSLAEKKASYTTTKWEKAGASKERNDFKPTAPSVDKAPPPLIGRRKELLMAKSADSSSSDEEPDFTTKVLINKKAPAFKFKIKK